MDPLQPPPDAHHIVTDDGEAFIWQPHPHVVVQKASGVLSLSFAQGFGDFYRPLLVPGTRVQVFDDFEELTLYTREAREYITDLTIERLEMVESIHFLLASKLMALGVSAFKHQVGDDRVRVYSDRESFLRSYERAIGQSPTP